MLRKSAVLSASLLQAFGSGKTSFFTSLWNKPQTRDERVKDYVPEVLEESLAEQRAVLDESTSRDVIVDLGHKILREIDNKSPTPSIAPHLNKLLVEYGAKDLIAQRPLSYLLYPSSSPTSSGQQAHELVTNFADNFRNLIEEVERSGCSARREIEGASSESSKAEGGHSHGTDEAGKGSAQGPSESGGASGKGAFPFNEQHEPLDITLFVRVVSGMAMANVQCKDFKNAAQCVDAALAHAVDPQRLGGLLGLKAGILVHQKKFDEAAEVAQLAVEASGNVQGYLHGAFALKMLRRHNDIVALLEKGREDHPMNMLITAQLEAAKKEIQLQISK